MASNPAPQVVATSPDPGPDEEIFVVRPSMRMVWVRVVLVLVVVAVVEIVLLAALQLGASHWGWRLGAYLAAVAAVAVHGALRQFTERYRLTKKYIYTERGILSRTTDQVDLRRYRDLRVNEPLTERLLGLGNIEIVSTDTLNPLLKLRDLPAPQNHAALIRSAAEKARPAILDVE